MRVYTVPSASSDPTIGAQDIRIVGDQVAIVLSKETVADLRSIIICAKHRIALSSEEYDVLTKLQTLLKRVI